MTGATVPELARSCLPFSPFCAVLPLNPYKQLAAPCMRKHLQPSLGLQPLREGLPNQTSLQESLHEPHWTERHKVITALSGSPLPSHQKWSDRMARCGNHASFFMDPAAGKVRPWLSRCAHRLCPFCARARSAHVAEQLYKVMVQMSRPRLLVLTVKSDDSDLTDQLANLRFWFRKLRKRKLWRSKVKGGCYVVEVTLNKDTGQWHPHIHVIFDGDYLPQQLLRTLWHEITGDSEIVWLQEVTDRDGMSRELSKYIGKPQRLSTLTATQINDYATAIHGNRMVQSFGNTYGIEVTDEDKKDLNAPEIYRVPLGKLMHYAREGHVTPQRLLLLISKRWEAFTSYILHAMPQLDPVESQARKTARMLAVIHGPGSVTHAPPKIPVDRERLDAEIFVQFQHYKMELELNTYEPTSTTAEVA